MELQTNFDKFVNESNEEQLNEAASDWMGTI